MLNITTLKLIFKIDYFTLCGYDLQFTENKEFCTLILADHQVEYTINAFNNCFSVFKG